MDSHNERKLRLQFLLGMEAGIRHRLIDLKRVYDYSCKITQNAQRDFDDRVRGYNDVRRRRPDNNEGDIYSRAYAKRKMNESETSLRRNIMQTRPHQDALVKVTGELEDTLREIDILRGKISMDEQSKLADAYIGMFEREESAHR